MIEGRGRRGEGRGGTGGPGENVELNVLDDFSVHVGDIPAVPCAGECPRVCASQGLVYGAGAG